MRFTNISLATTFALYLSLSSALAAPAAHSGLEGREEEGPPHWRRDAIVAHVHHAAGRRDFENDVEARKEFNSPNWKRQPLATEDSNAVEVREEFDPPNWKRQTAPVDQGRGGGPVRPPAWKKRLDYASEDAQLEARGGGGGGGGVKSPSW